MQAYPREKRVAGGNYRSPGGAAIGTRVSRDFSERNGGPWRIKPPLCALRIRDDYGCIAGFCHSFRFVLFPLFYSPSFIYPLYPGISRFWGSPRSRGSLAWFVEIGRGNRFAENAICNLARRRRKLDPRIHGDLHALEIAEDWTGSGERSIDGRGEKKRIVFSEPITRRQRHSMLFADPAS